MLRHLGLIDPIDRTRNMDVVEFTKYTDIKAVQVGQTDSEVVNEIKVQFYQSHFNGKNQDKLDRLWGFIRPKVEENAGLAQFILDYEGARSRFFFPWLYNAYHSPSLALEMSYGAGDDINGVWHDKIPESDQIDSFVKNDPTFVYNRERQLMVADHVTTIQDISHGCPEHISRVVDFSAGRMAWARWHGFQFKPDIQRIYASDRDRSIDIEKVFEADPASLGLEYVYGDIMAQVNNAMYMGADSVILSGIATCIRKDVLTQAVVMPIYHLMNPGGTFFLDFQIDCPYLKRNMSIFDWPKMYLADNVENAIGEVESIREDLWKNGCKMSAEYTVDTYNESPTAIVVIMQKL